MPRHGPVEKRSRRAGVELSLKGARLLAGKSGLRRRPHPPGPRTATRRRATASDHLRQLREKQKLQWFYGVRAGQLQRYFDASRREAGSTGAALLRHLEQRLDNTVYRLGLAGTRAQARQLVGHGHVQVDGTRVDRPSYAVRRGETIAIRPGSSVEPIVRDALSLGFQVPAWLSVDHESLSGKVLRDPEPAEVNAPVDVDRVVEFLTRY
ncbi:MAG TPA: 30S ribosomal protein S4 [Candidatus Limnocylindrales bacterium]|nr:30S ribosomal protein S4 [Candidatus Limnocylindrales bacterium]